VQASDAEVRQLWLVPSRPEDVGRLHVTVEHADVMSSLQRAGDLGTEVDGLAP
jgi:hypothetical protein